MNSWESSQGSEYQKKYWQTRGPTSHLNWYRSCANCQGLKPSKPPSTIYRQMSWWNGSTGPWRPCWENLLIQTWSTGTDYYHHFYLPSRRSPLLASFLFSSKPPPGFCPLSFYTGDSQGGFWTSSGKPGKNKSPGSWTQCHTCFNYETDWKRCRALPRRIFWKHCEHRNTPTTGAWLQTSEPGDRVLLLLLTSKFRLLARWRGPFEVVRNVAPVGYKVQQPRKQKEMQIYHVNLRKAWKAQEGLMIVSYPLEPWPWTLATGSTAGLQHQPPERS